MALQTPGQTPDSLALYDERESWVFVGDTLYQRIAEMPWGEMHELPIILVAQRHWGDFVGSLLDFVTQKKTGKGLRLSSGHSTPGIVAGDGPVIAELPGDEVALGGSLGNETWGGFLWQDDGDLEFSLQAPARCREEF